MAEAHQPLLSVEQALDQALGITGTLHLFDHRQHLAGAPPCSGPDIAPIAPDSDAQTSAPVDAITRAVKVEAFMPLRGRHPVCVDGLDVWDRVLLPAGHESCCHSGTFVDPALRHRGLVNPARGLRDVGQRHHRRAGHLLAAVWSSMSSNGR